MHNLQFYIGGQWVDPAGSGKIDVENPSTEEVFTQIAAGTAEDVDRAVKAARAAFASWSNTSVEERLEHMLRIRAGVEKGLDRMANILSEEMGAPAELARVRQATRSLVHLDTAIQALREFEFTRMQGTTQIRREAIGVAGLITPWNWPLNQIVAKVAAALAAGCTMVLKPSELAPLNAIFLAEIIDEAGLPAGVFNLVNGDGPTVGSAMSSHPDIDMISITGSTRAGILVAKSAADTVKRVAQELGGKSPNILLPDADFERAVTLGMAGCYSNSGQACVAPTRMFVPADRKEEIYDIARRVAAKYRPGQPHDPDTNLGPVISKAQFEKVQRLIQSAIDEGATLVAGGPGRPEGVNKGYFIRPTVFGDVTPDMQIAREEIFGTVLSILPYDDVDHAVAMANDTEYGLAAYVQSADQEAARAVGRRLRAGMVHLNYPTPDAAAPFGGYKQSGNGREYGAYGIDAYLETKAIIGY